MLVAGASSLVARGRPSTTGDDSACSRSWQIVSAWLEPPGAVQHQKTARAASLVCSLGGGCSLRGEATRENQASTEVRCCF
jgi:hypothetical protein